LGIGTWALFLPQVGGKELAEAFPGQLAGLLAAVLGMVAGSLAPQGLLNRHERVHAMAGMGASEPRQPQDERRHPG
jgi:solute:Na+ symporter, SSS family